MHPHKRLFGAGLFWQSLLLTLLLVLPMVGVVLFLSSQRQQQVLIRQAAAGAGGVAVEAGAQSTYRLLLAVQQDTPAFVLLRIDAPAQRITLCALPGSLRVVAPTGYTTLADCYMAAGPARAAQLLGATAGLAPDAYIAATPGCWGDILAAAQQQEITARLDTAALLPQPAREELAAQFDMQGGSVAVLTPYTAARLIQQGDAAGETPLRAAVYAAFMRQNTALLPALPQGAKANSTRTLTDLTAQQYADIADTLAWLAGRPALEIDYTAPETDSNAALSAAGLAEVKALLG